MRDFELLVSFGFRQRTDLKDAREMMMMDGEGGWNEVERYPVSHAHAAKIGPHAAAAGIR